MAFSFEHHESAAHGILRIAREQLELAGQELDGSDATSLDEVERVHSVRKRTKKLRALLRLIQPALGAELRHSESIRLRDAARQLAEAREAAVLLATFDRLVAHYADSCAPDAFLEIRSALASRQQHDGAAIASDEARQVAGELIRAALASTASWQLDPHGFALITRGLADTYRSARRAFARAHGDGSSEDFHQWRKRTKDHWYHVRMLVPVWPVVLEALDAELRRLSELLGDDHDLADLRRAIEACEAAVTNPSASALLVLLERRRDELKRDAHALGERVFAERTKPLVRRFRAYFQAWQHDPSLI